MHVRNFHASLCPQGLLRGFTLQREPLPVLSKQFLGVPTKSTETNNTNATLQAVAAAQSALCCSAHWGCYGRQILIVFQAEWPWLHWALGAIAQVLFLSVDGQATVDHGHIHSAAADCDVCMQ